MSFEGLEGKKAVAFRREASRQPLANWVPGREEEKILVVPQEAGIGLVTARKKVGVDVDAMFRDRIGGLTRGVAVQFCAPEVGSCAWKLCIPAAWMAIVVLGNLILTPDRPGFTAFGGALRESVVLGNLILTSDRPGSTAFGNL